MKTRRFLSNSLAFALTLAFLLPSGASGQEAKPWLSSAGAREAALPVAWEVARRNQTVNSVKLHGCDRRAADRFVCLAFDRGSTSELATTCRVWVRVEGTDTTSKATLTLIDCKNHRFALLRAAEAEAAMLAEAQRIGGPEVRLSMLGRQSRVETEGEGFWLRPASSDPTKKELCEVALTATLVGDQVQVRVTQGPTCLLPVAGPAVPV
jgi:hypothetical protein